MKNENFITFRGSLLTKSIVVCVVILVFVGGIVAANLVSFRDIQHVLSTIIDRDVAQIIENARLSREISQVFAETNLLMSTFIDHPEYLRSEGERLLNVLQRNLSLFAADSSTEKQIRNALKQFSQRLRVLLDQCVAVNDMSQSIEVLHGDITAELMSLEKIVAGKMIAMIMEENDEEIFSVEQLSTAIPGYRDMLSQMAILLTKTKHEYLTKKEIEGDTVGKEQFFTLLKEFDADLRIVTKTGRDFVTSGEQLGDAVIQYEKRIETYYQEMKAFQVHVTHLDSAQEQLLAEIKVIDSQVAQSASGIKEEAIDAIRSSRDLVVYLSMIIFAILIALGYYVFGVIRPIKALALTAALLAEGDITSQPPLLRSRDEIGILSQAFKNLMGYIQEMAEAATGIARGDLSKNIQPRSERDVLGNAFREMASYLNDMAGVAGAVAEGNLTEVVQVRSDADAFGKMFRTMTEGLHALIVQIRSCAEEIASTETAIKSLSAGDIELAHNVDDLMTQSVSTMNDMGDGVQNVAHNMETLSSAVEETSTSVSHMASTVVNIASNATTLNERIQQMGKFQEETMRSLQKVVENTELSQQLAQKTNQDAFEGREAVEHVVTSMQTIQKTVTTAVDAMTRFEARSQEIDTVLEVIREITDQTSLLALNASIISAQAGMHGRGFAVVAEEIRNLAQGVGASTKSIASIVTTLQQETAEVAHTIRTGAENVEQGMGRTRQARGTLEKILSSTQRSSSVVTEMTGVLHGLAESTRHVSVAMEQVSAMTDEITLATSEHQASTKQIRQAIEHINTRTSEIQLVTEQQSTALRQVLDEARDVARLIGQSVQSSQHISQTTRILASQADILLHSVDRFTLKK
ncbi:MAG: HAMP domain-containing protein [bacterium]|nr:HAMP domain-containing protein [bacterium]